MARSDRPRQKRIARAEGRLRQSINGAVRAYGIAQWTNGYRTGNPAKEAELHPKEMAQWKRCEQADALVTRCLAGYRRAIQRT